jgi:hypothetical protein
MDTYGIIAVFGIGLFCGVMIVRYGILLGADLACRIKEDLPVFDEIEPTEQDVTGE